MKVPEERRRFLLFILTGGFSALVNVGARAALSSAMPFGISVVIAYVIAMVVAYALSRAFVFEHSGRNISEELSKFAIVNAVALLQVWLVSMTMRHYIIPWLGWPFYPDLTAHFVGVASPVLTSYFGHKYFSFRPVARQPRRPE